MRGELAVGQRAVEARVQLEPGHPEGMREDQLGVQARRVDAFAGEVLGA